MGLNDKQIEHFSVRQAGMGLSPGIIFGEQGSGFMRMNIAGPKSVIAEALEKNSGGGTIAKVTAASATLPMRI
jgi:bifunctional pyridoxal-dependent enzyme with beta-cystathionase and maltose regulon repressor activities